MNKNIPILFLIVALGIFILSLNSSLFTITTPGGLDSSIDSYVNSYYSPTISSTRNSEKCSIPNVIIGSTFAWDIKSFPTQRECLVQNGKYYKVTKISSSLNGDCTSIEGKQVLINNKAPFKNFLYIKQGEDYILCKNLDFPSGKYKYIRFSPSKTKSCTITYTLPETERQGKYYCDQKKGQIYRIPCGNAKKELIETCSLGCEKVNKQLDSGVTEVVKCKGDYKPNVKVCSTNGKQLFTVNSVGSMTIDSCCSCSNEYCKKCTVQTNLSKGCTRIGGDGSNKINVFFYNDSNALKHEEWIISYLPTQVPYNEFTFNFYRENHKYDCRGIVTEKNNDVRIGYENLKGYSGWGQPSDGKGHAGNLIFDERLYSARTPHFLLLHELGHIYTKHGHTCDNSIMDANGGTYDHSKVVYALYQVDLIRKNLISKTPVYPSADYGKGDYC